MVQHGLHIMTPNQVKAVRRSTKLNQAEFATLLQISVRQLSSFETGEKNVDLKTALALAWISKYGCENPWGDYGLKQ